MKLLVVGGAGYVGTILRPALEAAHACRYYDRDPVPGAEANTIVADVNDEQAVAPAVAGMDAVLYLAMGVGVVAGRKTTDEVNPAFDVNVRGLYRFITAAIDQGVKRFVYASTLSVYADYRTVRPFDESVPADAWNVYGVSKRLGEHMCAIASQRAPDASIVALRLMMPRQEKDFAEDARYRSDRHRNSCWLGPEDTRRIFLAALACDRPGLHIVQATGDLEGKTFSLQRAREVLGWTPLGS